MSQFPTLQFIDFFHIIKTVTLKGKEDFIIKSLLNVRKIITYKTIFLVNLSYNPIIMILDVKIVGITNM